MDFKTPKTSQITDTAVAVASAFGGAAVSNVAVAQIIGEPKADADTKKVETKKRTVKGIFTVAAIAGACFVQGNDTAAQVTRNALIGAAATQGLSLVKEFVDDQKDRSKLVKQAVGLGCACGQSPLAQPVWLQASMYDNYSYDQPQYEVVGRNPLANFTE